MAQKYTTTQIIKNGTYTLSKGDSIVINKTAKEEIEQGASVAAIQSDLEPIPTTETVTLNGNISVTDKADDASDESTHKTFGLDLQATVSTTIRTDNAAKINVTRENLTKMGEAVAYGIANRNGNTGTNTGALVFDGDFLDAITVRATNSYKEGIANTTAAYGILVADNITFDGAINAAIKATSTAKTNGSSTYGIYMNKSEKSLTVKDDILKDISATATGNGGQAQAYAIKSDGTLVIGAEGIGNDADIAGKITATATGNAALNDDGTARNANARAYAAYGNSITMYGNITKNITTTATANGVKQSDKTVASGNATTYGLHASTELIINGAVSAAIKSTATAKAHTATANGIHGKSKVTITNGITKDITATTTGAATTISNTANFAYAICSSQGGVTIGTAGTTENAIAGKLTTKTTANATLNADKSQGKTGNADAISINSKSTITIHGDITKNISATATTNSVKQSDGIAVSGIAKAYGFKSDSELTINGAVSGAIKATATAKANQAIANGIYGGSITITDGITKDITATTTGAANLSAAKEESIPTLNSAAAIASSGDLIIGTAGTTKNAIAGKLTAKATGNAALSADKSTGYAGNAEASGLYSSAAITINGDITKNISATATANSVKQSDETAVSGTANAYGIYAKGNITIGDIKGKITVNATSKTNTVQANGIFTPSKTLTLDSSLGTINATATGVGGTACGVKTNGIVYKGDVLTGKITATYKTGSATGMQVKNILHSTGDSTEAGTAMLTITVTAKKATGLFLSDNTGGQLTLSATKITAKTTDKTNGTARAIASESMSVQDIALTDKTVLTGSVELGKGDDTLTLKGQSKINGDVDLGEDDDTINIYTGSQIKGDVKNVEKCSFTFDTLKYASTALWEGEEFSCKESQGMSIAFSGDVIDELKAGKMKTFTLLKDTDGNVWGSEGTEKINLNIGGATGVTNVGADITLGGCKLNIHIDAKGKQLLCDVVKLA